MVKFLGSRIYLVVVIIAIIVVVLIGFVWWNFVANRVADLPAAVPPTAPSAGA